MTTAISYATEIWLADLRAQGWTLAVTERLPVVPVTTLRCVEDDFQPLDLLAPVRQVGVLATRSAGVVRPMKRPEATASVPYGDAPADSLSGVFVPCSSEVEAWRLLERIEEET